MSFRRSVLLAIIAGLGLLGAGLLFLPGASKPLEAWRTASAEQESVPASQDHHLLYAAEPDAPTDALLMSLAADAPGEAPVEQTGALLQPAVYQDMPAGALQPAVFMPAGQDVTAQADAPEEAAGEDAEAPAEALPAETAGQAGSGPAPAFDFAQVIAEARALASLPYEAPSRRIPSSFANLGYDQYRQIRPKPQSSDWQDAHTSFRVAYAPQGFLFTDPVTINIVEDGQVTTRAFDPEAFSFSGLEIPQEDREAITFSGLRLLAPLNEAGKFDEFLSFQGASYFRALGAGNRYGISARGLALSTASPSGEEFPAFRKFWLERPQPGATRVHVYALLDSPGVAGAFHFTTRPGAATVIDVEAVLIPRRALDHVGLAPLTSMFEFGPQDPLKAREDFRPRVHDSEGLMIRMRNGEWVWRPLVNPSQLEISSFTREVPHGFGLMQRSRNAADYQDLEARYDLRPSLWIEPQGDWPAGHLVLVEIPTTNEFNDNIVAFWRPEERWEAGQEYRIDYTMHWGDHAPIRPSFAQVESTRVGVPINAPANRLFVIDFVSGNNAQLDAAEVSVSASQGRVHGVTLQDNPLTGGRRLTFELSPEGASVSELRAVLTRSGEPVSETWLYRWRRG